jgi:hypothetical protein
MVIAKFTSPVHVRKIMIIGGGDEVQHPSELRCYVNHEVIDFTNVGSITPAQQFNLSVNADGTTELITAIRPFTNVTSLVFFFPANFGSERTIIKYIGMQGEHTHYRREAVDTVYEVLCNGQDIVQPEEQAGAHTLGSHGGHGHHMH